MPRNKVNLSFPPCMIPSGPSSPEAERIRGMPGKILLWPAWPEWRIHDNVSNKHDTARLHVANKELKLIIIKSSIIYDFSYSSIKRKNYKSPDPTSTKLAFRTEPHGCPMRRGGTIAEIQWVHQCAMKPSSREKKRLRPILA